jgi:hypothetical protein
MDALILSPELVEYLETQWGMSEDEIVEFWEYIMSEKFWDLELDVVDFIVGKELFKEEKEDE